MPSAPFVVGQWVRAEKFYGRAALIREILDGARDAIWVVGTRRIGKTSLLRQIEHVTASAVEPGYWPLFWSLEGASDPEELRMNFRDALLDAEERLEPIGMRLADVEGRDLFSSLAHLRRGLRGKGLKLLLLCDEVEELIQLHQQDPSLLRKLRRALQAQDEMRAVLTSTIRLWALADQRSDTSPFLSGFEPPLYIHNLSDDEARALIRQANLPSESRPRIDETTLESIRVRCDNHPYLIQLLCKRCLELESLDEAVEQVAADPMLSFFFGVDFEMLSDEERRMIRLIAERDAPTSDSIRGEVALESSQIGTRLLRLEQLGYIRRNGERRYVLANDFFRRWLLERPQAAEGPRSQQPTIGLDAPRLLDGRYELLERVGGGGMGTVYRAHDRLLRAAIAVKLIRRECTARPEAVERVRREILLARDIAHPNVVRVYHLGEFEGQTYITMEWMGGSTLADVIAKESPVGFARGIGIATRIASALQAAHAVRVLHRDIKPSNVLLDEAGEPHLSDFGLARLVGDASLTSHGTFLGTPDYASPEQAATLPLDERSDLYSLGVLLFELVTGRRPFVSTAAVDVLTQHRSAPPPDPRTLRPEVPPDLAELVLRCLEKDPPRRFRSAGDLRLALERLGQR